MSEPLFNRSAAPSAAPNEPSVTTSGGMRALAISSPLSRPHAVPDTTATSSPTMIGPQPSLVGSPLTPNVFSVLPAIMLAKISTEPTDRSMPAVMITNVMPTDRINSTDVSISVVCALNRVGNACGASTLNTTHSTTSTSAIQNTLAPTNFCRHVRWSSGTSVVTSGAVAVLTRPPGTGRPSWRRPGVPTLPQ